MKVFNGDCVDLLPLLVEADSIDAIVCDPPYGLEFMGKEWDRLEPARSKQRWAGTERRGLIGNGQGVGGHFGDRVGELPTYRPRRNARCLTCQHYRFSSSPCTCAEPKWDNRANEHNIAQQAWHARWAEQAFRVLKPGGYLVAFGGTRTSHRLTCALEDAGFEIRDQLSWMYGQGFPKSLDISKAIDKAAGAEREVIGSKLGLPGYHLNPNEGGNALREGVSSNTYETKLAASQITAPATPEAEAWNGWGTALKPAFEPIILARKPLGEKTVAANVLKHGTGGLNIDGCRIATQDNLNGGTYSGGKRNPMPGDERSSTAAGRYGEDGRLRPEDFVQPEGRWPANVVLTHGEGCVEVGTRKVKGITGGTGNHDGSVYGARTNQGAIVRDYANPDGTETIAAWDCEPDCPVRLLDEQSGSSTSAIRRGDGVRMDPEAGKAWRFKRQTGGFSDTGGASRFFYQGKANNGERWGYCKTCGVAFNRKADGKAHAKPHDVVWHPTVKPVDLMRWLVRLVTPPGGTVLDPFAGTGTTGEAAQLEGFDAVLFEQDPIYATIIETRLA